jgi:hypothetical protein
MSDNNAHAATANSELGHEGFMSAADLRTYMNEMQAARAGKVNLAADAAEAARAELAKKMSAPIDLTPAAIEALKNSLMVRMKQAAERNETEMMVMRFPNGLCTDRGRAINNSEAEWPETLTARPRQAYEFWRDHLRDDGFRLKSTIIEWPSGMPGDVGLFLAWGDDRAR